MKCIALLETGNHVYKLESALKKKGYEFEIISTPCRLARGGCSLCLRFPEEQLNIVRHEAMLCNTPIKAIYRITDGVKRNRYQRL